MANEIPTGTAAEVLAMLRRQMARNDADSRLRNDRRYAIAGTLLADGSYRPLADVVDKLRANLQGDDQRLFDRDVLLLDGWTKQKEAEGKLSWSGPKTSTQPPEPQDTPTSASPVERAWEEYLAKMAEPGGWAQRQRRRAFLLGSCSDYSGWCRKQNPVVLAKRARSDEQGLFHEQLLKDDGWSAG